MDWLKKHYEKVTLAMALVLLIASAALLSLKVNKLSQDVQNAPGLSRPGKTVDRISLASYSNVLAYLAQPAVWTNSIDMFNTGDRTNNPVKITMIEDHATITPQGPPVILHQIRRELFELMFESYAGDGRNFQLNFITRSKTFFIDKVGDRVADKHTDTGYVISTFNRTNAVEEVTGIGPRPVDRSELILKRENEPPILLVLGKVTELREPVATVSCPEQGRQQRVRRDDKITCGTNTYNVVDIAPRQMIIINSKTGEKHVISPINVPR
jgi:hypothetical protein